MTQRTDRGKSGEHLETLTVRAGGCLLREGASVSLSDSGTVGSSGKLTRLVIIHLVQSIQHQNLVTITSRMARFDVALRISHHARTRGKLLQSARRQTSWCIHNARCFTLMQMGIGLRAMKAALVHCQSKHRAGQHSSDHHVALPHFFTTSHRHPT